MVSHKDSNVWAKRYGGPCNLNQIHDLRNVTNNLFQKMEPDATQQDVLSILSKVGTVL